MTDTVETILAEMRADMDTYSEAMPLTVLNEWADRLAAAHAAEVAERDARIAYRDNIIAGHAADTREYQKQIQQSEAHAEAAEARYNRMLAKYERMEQRFADYRADRESEIEAIKSRRGTEHYKFNAKMDRITAPPPQPRIDPSWSLHDRVEFALRDAGFDYDEAFRIARLADSPQPREGMVVDDAMVERGVAGYEREWDKQEKRNSDSVPFTALVRSVLESALAPFLAAAPGEPVSNPDELPDDAPFPEGWDEGRKYRCVRTGRQPPSEGELPELEQVVRFLLGEGELDGRFYGDEPPRGEGHTAGYGAPYWWRRHLRAAWNRRLAASGQEKA